MKVEQEPKAGVGPPTWLSWSRIQQILSYAGLAGAGGSGLALLCFGIGFLAVRSHDEMLGLPSRAMAHGATVREGAMFFLNSLYYLFVAAWKALAVAMLLVMLAAVFEDWVARILRRLAAALAPTLARASHAASFVTIHSLLLLFAVLLFEDRAATLHPVNRHLLSDRSSDALIPQGPQPPPQGQALSGAQWGPAHFTAARAAHYFLYDRLKGKKAWVNTELLQDEEKNGPDGEQEVVARKHYGLSVALLVLLIVLLAVERISWRSPPSLRRFDAIIRPVLYVLALALVVTLPAAYGVLWMPRGATWVEITAPPEQPTGGYLLTDISGDEPDVWTIALPDATFTMRVSKRESISEIRISGDYTNNLLAEVRKSVSPDGMEGDAGAHVTAAK